MMKKEKLLKITVENGGYITTKELSKYNINNYFLIALVKEGKLIRVSRGY